ncbi:Uncharacterized protein dnm_098750 [Desulfonema magnum]|uniref:Uncharacterized protein n=1 Tax=Desulfonema magnum TaxID=45655 RepID=A0A975BYA8_9BACT|nr:Uncharacterized protein dnm_098750 [Desulfonema magnum]
MRGATIPNRKTLKQCAGFNPRPPCGERQEILDVDTLTTVSIHAPRAGSDTLFYRSRITPTKFQSTPPVRGATS